MPRERSAPPPGTRPPGESSGSWIFDGATAARLADCFGRGLMDDNRPVTNKQRLVSAAVLVLGVAAVGGPAEAPADFVLTGGRIWTAEAARPWAEAVATRDGRIIYVGDAAGASRHRGPKTKLFPLGGRLVVPGFDDAHIHLMSGALSLERVDPSRTRRSPPYRPASAPSPPRIPDRRGSSAAAGFTARSPAGC